MKFYSFLREAYPFFGIFLFLLGFGLMAFTLGTVYDNKREPPQIPWRYGDKVIITHGFYAQQKARIMGREWIGNKWRYELWGDGETAIDPHTRFDETEFVLREER